MTIALDVISSFPDGTASTSVISWLHVPTGTPKGALVYVFQALSADDTVTSVTYAGLGMTEVTGSPQTFSDGSFALGSHAFFLGTSVPAGTATIVVTCSTGGGLNRNAVAVTVTGAADIEIHNSFGGTSAAGTMTVSFTLSSTAWAIGGGVVNFANPVNNSPQTGWTEDFEFDMGAYSSYVYVGGNKAPAVINSGLNTAATASARAVLVQALIEASASTPTNITAAAAVISVVGGVGSLLSPTNISATAAAVVLSGNTATIYQASNIAASAGLIVVSGAQATVVDSAPATIEATAGLIVLTGMQATIADVVPVRIEATVGTIVLTGTQATISAVGPDFVESTVGLIVVTGGTGNIVESVKDEVSATFGLIVVSGTTATISEAVPAVPTSVEASAGVIVVGGGTGNVTEGLQLKGGRPRRRYTTYIEPTAPEVPGTVQTKDGAAFGSLAPMLPAPAITPPLASARPKIKLLKPKPKPEFVVPEEAAPRPLPRKPHLVVIEGRAHVDEAVPPMVVDRVAVALEQLAGAIRQDPRIARQVTEALLPLLVMPTEEDEEEELIRMLLLQQGAV